jgi:hypothetical protein
MKRAIIFLLIAALATFVIALLFGVIVCAPEEWQTRPWTLWERCAQVLFNVLGWPLTAIILLLDQLPWKMPDKFSGPFFCLGFVVSGAFWAAVIQMVWNRVKRKRTPNRVAGD